MVFQTAIHVERRGWLFDNLLLRQWYERYKQRNTSSSPITHVEYEKYRLYVRHIKQIILHLQNTDIEPDDTTNIQIKIVHDMNSIKSKQSTHLIQYEFLSDTRIIYHFQPHILMCQIAIPTGNNLLFLNAEILKWIIYFQTHMFHTIIQLVYYFLEIFSIGYNSHILDLTHESHNQNHNFNHEIIRQHAITKLKLIPLIFFNPKH